MAASIVLTASTITLSPKSTAINPKLTTFITTKSTPALISLPKTLKFSSHTLPSPTIPTSSAIAAAIFSYLSSSDPALAVQQISDIADGDSRGLALLIPIVPAILWVLYNILQPALNQINKMRSVKGIAIGLGLGIGLGLSSSSDASAGEIAVIAETVSGDNRGLLLLVPVAVAIAWVLFNILQPALNQINKMRSG